MANRQSISQPSAPRTGGQYDDTRRQQRQEKHARDQERFKKVRNRLLMTGLAIGLALGTAIGWKANDVAAYWTATPEEQRAMRLEGYENEHPGFDFSGENMDSVTVPAGGTAWDTAYREVSRTFDITLDAAGSIERDMNPGVSLGDVQPWQSINIPGEDPSELEPK